MSQKINTLCIILHFIKDQLDALLIIKMLQNKSFLAAYELQNIHSRTWFSSLISLAHMETGTIPHGLDVTAFKVDTFWHFCVKIPVLSNAKLEKRRILIEKQTNLIY